MIRPMFIHTPSKEDFDAAAEYLTLRGIVFIDGDTLTATDITVQRGDGPEYFSNYYELHGADTVIALENAKGSGVTKVVLGSVAETTLYNIMASLQGEEPIEVVHYSAGDTIEIEGEINPLDPTAEEEIIFYHFKNDLELLSILTAAESAGYTWSSGHDPLYLYEDIIEEDKLDVVVVSKASQRIGDRKLAVTRAIEVVDHGDGAKLHAYNGQSIE